MTARRSLALRGALSATLLALAGCVAVAPTVRPDADPGGRTTSVRATGGQAPGSPGPARPGVSPAAAGSPAAGASPEAGSSPAAGSPAPPAASAAATTPLGGTPLGTTPLGGTSAAPIAPVATPLVFSSPTSTGASPVPNPFGLPTTVRLGLPAGLEALLVSNNGGSLISDRGGSLITDNGAGILGKMKYGVRQAASPVPSAAPSRTPGQAAAKLIVDTLENLTVPQKLVDLMLQGAVAAQLQPGQTATFQFGTPARTHVMALAVAGDHATLTIDEAATPDPAKRIAALAYTSPTRGKVVYLDRPAIVGLPKIGVSETFDLDAGTITAAAAASFPGLLAGSEFVQSSRYELRRLDGSAAGRAFSLRTCTVQHQALSPLLPGGYKIAADFATDGAGAYWAEVFNKLGGPFLYPVDGVSYGKTPPAPYAFYMRTDGEDLAEASASDALKALLPALEVAVPAYPASPKDADPFADPVFAFPE